jgi:hypothetical protein
MRLIAIFTSLALLGGCTQPERLSDSAPMDPRRSMPQTSFEAVTMDVHSLKTHAQYDTWENAVIARSGASLAYMLYKEALVRKRGNQRTFVRWMVLSFRDELGNEFRDPLQKFLEGLLRSKDMSPDVRYLMGFVAWNRLTGGTDKAQVPVMMTNAALLDTVIKGWTELAAADPDWVGPHGITAAELMRRVRALEGSIEAAGADADRPMAPSQTVGGQVQSAVADAYAKVGRKPAWSGAAQEADEAFEDFHRIYEDKGTKKGCERIAAALKLMNDPTRLGDGPAYCALDRGDPFGAIDQIRRMASARVTGGLGVLLSRLQEEAASTGVLATPVAELKAELTAIAKTAPRWAERSGLAALLK